MVEHWNSLPRKAVESPSSETFSTQQYVDQSNLIYGGSAPEVLSNLNYPMIPSNIDLSLDFISDYRVSSCRDMTCLPS